VVFFYLTSTILTIAHFKRHGSTDSKRAKGVLHFERLSTKSNLNFFKVGKGEYQGPYTFCYEGDHRLKHSTETSSEACQEISSPPGTHFVRCRYCCSAGDDCKAARFVYPFILDSSAKSCLVEIEQLRESQAVNLVEKTLKEIPRPNKITKLQHDMGLADDKKLYSHCRVFLFVLTVWLWSNT